MQELLTGKRRLPGFKDEWVEKRLENVANILKGYGLSKAKIALEGCFPCILYGELFTEYNEIITSITSRTNYIEGVPSVKGDILIPASTTTIGIDLAKASVIPFDNVLLGGDINIIRPNDKNINSIFLAMYIMYTKRMEISIRAKGSTVYHLHGKDLFDLSLCIPPTLAEQTAIAEILSDMDTELSALKKKLEKIRLIKQGMMDALLTGKIRLPEDKPNVQFTQRKEQEEIPYAAEKTEEYTAEAKKAKHHANSEGYQDAVILAALVHRFGTKNFPFTAFDCQKFPYLFYRYMEGQTKGYRKFAAGPYNPALKYKTARPIALKKKYIQDHIGKYRGFISGINVQEALNYFQQWYGNEPLAWFEQFRYIPKRKDELELLTTTDMSMVEIRGEGRNITVQSVKELMKKNPEWKDKLNRPIFSDNNIERAIKWSYDLFGGEHD